MTDRRETPWLGRWAWCVNGLAAVLLLGWILYAATGKNLFGSRAWPDSVVDYRILYDMSRQVVHNQRYEPQQIFPYPPSAVVLLFVTALPPFPVAAGAWLALTILASVGTVVLGTSLVGLSNHPWRWSAALAAFALMDYYIQWDLRSQNSNMVYTFLLVAALVSMRRGQDTLVGLLLAASIALKLYPVLVLPYLWWIGKRRACAAAMGFLVTFFAILPLVFFGLDGLVSAYTSWVGQLRVLASTINESDHAILIALPFTLTKRLGADSPLVPWLAGAASAVWLGAVAACVLSGRPWRTSQTDGWDLAVDCGILALAPVVISPYLEPYHATPALLPILALVQWATVSSRPAVPRMFATVVLGTGWLALKVSGVMGFRGAGVLVQMLLVALALAAVRRMALSRAQSAPATSVCGGGDGSRK